MDVAGRRMTDSRWPRSRLGVIHPRLVGRNTSSSDSDLRCVSHQTEANPRGPAGLTVLRDCFSLPAFVVFCEGLPSSASCYFTSGFTIFPLGFGSVVSPSP